MRQQLILGLILVILTAGGYSMYMNYINGFSMSNQKPKVTQTQKNEMANMQMAEGEMEMMHQHGDHEHPPIAVDEWSTVPTLNLEAQYDGMGWVNLHLVTENFRFAPEDVNTTNIEGEGHAHLYINGEKISRIYSEWYFVGSDLLPQWNNTLRVELNGNTHGNLTLDGKNIESSIQIEVSPRSEGEGGSPW